jgi:hypothetical protein
MQVRPYRVGCANAHAYCLHWHFFQLAREKWPRSGLVVYLFAKFAAIWPEETSTLKSILAWIARREGHLVDAGFRCVQVQGSALVGQRSTSQTSETMAEYTRRRREIEPTKHRLRRVWDVVIQGNINSMEHSTKAAISALERNDTDFKHLIRRFPNNLQVIGTYTNFLRTILADEVGAGELRARYIALASNSKLITDQARELAMASFPMLPLAHPLGRRDQVPADVSCNAEFLEVDDPAKDDDELERKIVLRHQIDDLTIPAIVGIQIFRVLLLVVWVVIPAIVAFFLVLSLTERLYKPIEILGSLAQLRTCAHQVAAWTLRYIGERLGVYTVLPLNPQAPPVSLGLSWETGQQFEYVLKDTMIHARRAFGLRIYQADAPLIQQAQELFDGATVPYRNFRSSDPVIHMLTPSAALMDIVLRQDPVFYAGAGPCNLELDDAAESARELRDDRGQNQGGERQDRGVLP